VDAVVIDFSQRMKARAAGLIRTLDESVKTKPQHKDKPTDVLTLTFLGTRGEIKVRSRQHRRHSAIAYV